MSPKETSSATSRLSSSLGRRWCFPNPAPNPRPRKDFWLSGSSSKPTPPTIANPAFRWHRPRWTASCGGAIRRGRAWIFEYTLAVSKELLGYVRGKYTTVPIPGAEVTLNQQDLLAAATAEKSSLIEKLRSDLDELTRQKQLERKAAETTAMKSTLNEVPLPIFIG